MDKYRCLCGANFPDSRALSCHNARCKRRGQILQEAVQKRKLAQAELAANKLRIREETERLAQEAERERLREAEAALSFQPDDEPVEVSSQ